jgi:hypothetical protein
VTPNTAVETVQTITSTTPEWLRMPGHWPAQTDLITWCQTMGPGTAVLLLIGGVIYLAFGVSAFKWLVTLNATIVGAYFGAWVGAKADSTMPAAIVGGFTAAAIAWPMMKYAVALMGGVYGALLGAALWRSVGLQPELAWAGGLVGLVFFGLLSFILFRGSLMMYTSLQGAVMLVFGLLGLLFKYPDVGHRVLEYMSSKPFIFPMAIFIPALLGLLYQQTQFSEPEAKKK